MRRNLIFLAVATTYERRLRLVAGMSDECNGDA